jgi:uncharacterized protein
LAYVCVLSIELHFPDNGSLKGKRRELSSLKAQLQRRFGAAVAETDHHELWQRAGLTAALVGRDVGLLRERAADLERYVWATLPEGTRVDTRLISTEDLH